MIRFGLRLISALLVLSAVLPVAAMAQGDAPRSKPQSFDQYPSFIELTSVASDGTQIVLRCGYSVSNGKTVAPDPGFREISTLNEKEGSYSRLQHIDNVIVVTSTSPTGKRLLLLELVKPDGSVTTKNCQTDLDDDTIKDCKSAMPFTSVDQIEGGDKDMSEQCDAFVKQGASQFNLSLFSQEKTDAYMAKLREKINILEAP